MRRLTVDNPANRFEETELVYLEGEDAPAAGLEVYFDRTGSVLSKNDSPDIGFTYSVNPYRGCFHGCAYCLDGDTPILMADGTTRALRDVRVGDLIYGTESNGVVRKYVHTRVVAHWRTVKPAFRIALADGTRLIASADHRFLTERGWKHVTGGEQDRARRPHLTRRNRLIGTGAFIASPPETGEYEHGYLCGMIRGDALLKSYAYERAGRRNGDQHQFRLALVDLAALRRTRNYLERRAIETREFVFAEAHGSYKTMHAIRTSARGKVDQIRSLCAWPDEPTIDWQRGFLAGIFDAEGSYSHGVLRISNKDWTMLEMTRAACAAHGFDAIIEPPSPSHAGSVRVRGGLREHLRFFHLVDPAIVRKRSIVGAATKAPKRLDVVSVEPLGFDMLMFDITTGTGDFIANGVVSHNCYARPTHEYLSFGAGTDFERKIVVKRDAPALLRKALGSKGWRGELLMFSGVTDCYQPLESRYRLTRGCLEACVEYKNPVHLITKSPLIERDLDVLAELSRVAHVSVAISVPFVREEHARALEPFVTTPARRLRTIERIAAAGVRVGVSVAPIVPGLSDEEMPRVLEAARAAGASFAGYTLLRLPGHVKDVFEARIRQALPEKADRVLSHVRQSRNGKLYDATFGRRGRGEGPYAEAIASLFAATTKKLGYEQPESREEGSSGTVVGNWTTKDAKKALEATVEPRGQLSLFRC